MEARIRRILKKFLALGLALNVGLSAWGTVSFAQNNSAGGQNQSVYEQYQLQESALISQNTKSSVLPQAFASFTCNGDEVTHLNDGIFSYTDDPKNRWTSWTNPAMTGEQWVGILFGQGKTAVKHKITKLGIAFFEDGGCLLPVSYKVQYFKPDVVPMWPKSQMAHLAGKDNPLAKDENWQDVVNLVGNTTKDTIRTKEVNELTFDPVETYAIRIVMMPQPNVSLAATEMQAYGYSLGGAVVPQDPEENFNLNVFPSLRKYTAKNGKFKADSNMKLVVVASEKANKDARLREVAQLVSQEFGAYGIPKEMALPVVYGDKSDAADGDIVLELKDQVKDVPKMDGFAIQVGKKVEVQARTANGAMYALRSVMQYLHLKKTMPYGEIIDYPETDERALHLDMGRKYFTPGWIKNLIKELSFSRLNALQLHFSEHEGYRLECETYPDVMSKDYIKKDEMREIIAESKKYGVEIIPSFDNPGHLRTALRNYQDLCLVDQWGVKDTGALDINKEEARQFIKNIIKEYAELFVDSRYFHIGGDEFIDFNKFGRYPSLKEFGQKHVPQGVEANGQDGYMAYINEIAEYTKSLGFTPRIWNDGVYRLNLQPHINLHDYIQVCYWTRWDRNMASVDTFMEKGHDLINVNDMMYYVLTTFGKAYYKKPDPKKIYNSWDGGVFSGNNNNRPQTYDLPNDKIKGACYAIWCDVPGVETEEKVSQGIFYSLRAMAEKSWAGKQEKGEYDEFKVVLDGIGKAPGTEKPLPAAGAMDLKDLIEVRLVCQSESGQTLGLTEARLGKKGENYHFTAPDFKGFKLVEGAPSLSGVFDTNDTITLTYKRFVSRKPLEEALKTVFDENDYIPETYQGYKEAVEKAKALLTESSVTEIQITRAVNDMTEAAGKLVKKEWQPLYDRLKTPKPEDQYTKKTYEPYSKLVKNLWMRIQGVNTDTSKLADYMKQLDEAEASLKELGSEVEISVEVEGAGEYESYTFDKMLDGDRQTFAWTNQNQTVGQTFTFAFSSLVELSKVTLVYPQGSGINGVGQDYIGKAVLEVKGDGDWEKVADISGKEPVNPMMMDKKKVKQVRIRITEEKPNWTKIAEVEFDYKKWSPQPQQPDKTELEQAIEAAKAVKATDKYKNAEATKKEAFDKALTKAEEVNADAAADEAAVKEAAASLTAAMEALDGTTPQPQQPDKTELEQAIEAAKAVKATDKYKNAEATKKEAFDKALTKAEEVNADAAADEAAVKEAAASLAAATEELNGTTPTPNPGPNPGPNPEPQPNPNPDPEYDLPLAPYVPEQPSEPTPASVPAQPEVQIEEEQVALSSAESALVKELTKDMSKAEDKKLVEKLLAKQMKYPEFVQKLSDKALEELAANVGNHFKDETSGKWYAKELGALRLLNLITGYEDGTFRGSNPVTGKEYLTILVRAGQWDMEKSEDTNWFAPYQKTAQKIGLLSGISFELGKEATREEIAALSYNFIISMLEKVSAGENEIKFTDKEKIAENYRKAVAYLTQKGILKGYEDGSFAPEKLVGRDEVIAIIYRLLATLGK